MEDESRSREEVKNCNKGNEESEKKIEREIKNKVNWKEECGGHMWDNYFERSKIRKYSTDVHDGKKAREEKEEMQQ